MKTFLRFIFVLFFTLDATAVVTLTRAQETQAKKILTDLWGGPTKFSADVLKGEVVAQGEAHSAGGLQELHSKVIGLHPRTCATGLRKISRYEQYSSHMSFLKQSRYDDSNQQVYFLIDHAVLPFPMQLKFKIGRITSPGDYSFFFPDGIFQGLVGKIHIAPIGNRCLYFMRVDWKGKDTSIPDLVVGAFAQTLSKLGLEHLIRVSTI